MAVSATKNKSEGCPYVVGADGLARWSQVHSEAWIGLLDVSKRISRELDGQLEADYGIGLSSLELLGRLAAADDKRLQLTALADAAHLSLSRVSRLVDTLGERGLLERRQCPRDARSVEAELTAAGLQLTCEAQATHFAAVQERFFSRLEPGEIEILASVFGRLEPGAAQACSGG